MNRRLAALSVALSACAIGASVPRAVSPSLKTISIEQFAFSPAELLTAVGDTVSWLNRDAFTHTTAADSAAWSSPELSPGQRFMIVASTPGRFQYHCAAHPVMHGVLVVRER